MFRKGSWWLKSELDARWNASGRSEAVGGFTMPVECSQKVEELKVTLGEPPKDLEYGYMKD